VSTVAFETPVGLEHRLRSVPRRPGAPELAATPSDERKPPTSGDIEPWELHSELVLVCPEVCERARELLPERDPDAFLARAREPISLPAGMADDAQPVTSLFVAAFGYVLLRLAETARSALFVVGGVVALALLAEALH